MSVFKLKSKGILSLLGILVIAAVILIPILHDKSNKTPTNATQPGPNGTQSQVSYVQTADFKYLLPSGWAKISPADLQAAGAASGIATVTVPITQFRIAIEPAASSPKTLASLKTQTLSTIKQFLNFNLQTSESVKVGGQDGQSYVYKLGSDSKTEQELVVVLYKGRTFSLLFTGPLTNFQSQSATFDSIVASFQFL